MKTQELIKLFAVASAAVPGLLLSAAIASAQAISSDGFPASVPKAICGPTDHTESGLQGETTEQERFSGDSETAYNCNLELVGEEPQDTYQGAYSQDGPAYSGHCAYYGTDRGATTGQGIKVIDASNPQHPVVSTQLTDTAAALAPHETVHVQGGLLVAAQTTGPNFAVYDVSADCAHPVLKGSINASSNRFHHMGDFAPNGKRNAYVRVAGFVFGVPADRASARFMHRAAPQRPAIFDREIRLHPGVGAPLGGPFEKTGSARHRNGQRSAQCRKRLAGRQRDERVRFLAGIARLQCLVQVPENLHFSRLLFQLDQLGAQQRILPDQFLFSIFCGYHFAASPQTAS